MLTGQMLLGQIKSQQQLESILDLPRNLPFSTFFGTFSIYLNLTEIKVELGTTFASTCFNQIHNWAPDTLKGKCKFVNVGKIEA